MAEFFMRSGWTRFIGGPLDGQDRRISISKWYQHCEPDGRAFMYRHHLVSNADIMQYEKEENPTGKSEEGDSETNGSFQKQEAIFSKG
jgi:hypothetical protein